MVSSRSTRWRCSCFHPRKLLDSKTYQMGLRTIELRQEPDEWGESFTFVVNGVPVFAKGSDWIPADSFPTRISDEYLEGLIRSSVQAHMNMLRVWGGGFYEEERFYDLCDRYGMLVWQDFVFACGIYPDDLRLLRQRGRRSHPECAPHPPPRQPGAVVWQQ
jgi:beta-mannosidase